ncbi:Os10g0436825 [Oryza sativa Japonica Group]|uniref:Os10g0436825 protein n=1 Tax=Oryza sativa subsp. japonica TaxID=39947 RepID=A0A0P0XUH5_ORYSJ|nr:Os10g0436825 [Oryza sativa Japonica Group]
MVHYLDAYAVVSWPPPCVPVLTKNPAGFPASFCFSQREPVESKNAFICAAMAPYLVGNPNSTPSASSRSAAAAMTGTAGSLAGACIFSSTPGGSVSGTRRSTASTPSTAATPAAARRASASTCPYIE